MSQRDLSRHQQSIVKRYYKNLDTIVATRLGELVSDLYLAESDAKRARLWKSIRQQLAKTPADPAAVEALAEAGDLAGLAKLVNDLVAGKVVVRDDGPRSPR